MSKVTSPQKVLLMDDDFHALKWNTAIVMRDPRTTVVGETESPDDLLAYLEDKSNDVPDVIVVDTEYFNQFPTVDDLLTMIRKMAPDAKLVCLSQYGREPALKAALKNQASGFLLKKDVRMAIVPAIMQATRVEEFVISPGIVAQLELIDPHLSTHVFPIWAPNPNLTPQLTKAFWLRVFFGMRASLAAEEMFVETTTVERYINQAYKILPDTWAAEEYLFDVNLDEIAPEDQAFVWFTLPPAKR